MHHCLLLLLLVLRLLLLPLHHFTLHTTLLAAQADSGAEA
jgi:hypothetical protein